MTDIRDWRPQSEDELRDAVLRGQGRALIYLQRHGGDQHFETIRELCRVATSFTREMDDHSKYLWEIVQTLANPAELVPLLVDLLFSPDSGYYARIQHRALLSCFAACGNEQARGALRSDFHRSRLPERPHQHGVRTLGLEGLALMLRNARRLNDLDCFLAYEEAVKRFRQREVNKVLAQFRGEKTKLRFTKPWDSEVIQPDIDLTPDEMLE